MDSIFTLQVVPIESLHLFNQNKLWIELAQNCSLQLLGKTFSEFENLQINAQNLSPLCLPFHHAPYIIKLLKAAPRFELGIEDLQSTALPLGDTAFSN